MALYEITTKPHYLIADNSDGYWCNLDAFIIWEIDSENCGSEKLKYIYQKWESIYLFNNFCDRKFSGKKISQKRIRI